MQKAATVLDTIRKCGDYRAQGRDHWRARCWETSTAGSGSDKWKRAQSDWLPRQLSTSLGKGLTDKDRQVPRRLSTSLDGGLDTRTAAAVLSALRSPRNASRR